jgi:hypothetical protein
MFALAHHQGEENNNTVQAIHLASNTAERFSVDPTSVPEKEIADGLVVYTDVESKPQSTGTLYTATIEVYSAADRNAQMGSKPFYELETARYVRAGDA